MTYGSGSYSESSYASSPLAGGFAGAAAETLVFSGAGDGVHGVVATGGSAVVLSGGGDVAHGVVGDGAGALAFTGGGDATYTLVTYDFLLDTFTGAASSLDYHSGEAGTPWMHPTQMQVGGDGYVYVDNTSTSYVYANAAGEPASSYFFVEADVLIYNSAVDSLFGLYAVDSLFGNYYGGDVSIGLKTVGGVRKVYASLSFTDGVDAAPATPVDSGVTVGSQFTMRLEFLPGRKTARVFIDGALLTSYTLASSEPELAVSDVGFYFFNPDTVGRISASRIQGADTFSGIRPDYGYANATLTFQGSGAGKYGEAGAGSGLIEVTGGGAALAGPAYVGHGAPTLKLTPAGAGSVPLAGYAADALRLAGGSVAKHGRVGAAAQTLPLTVGGIGARPTVALGAPLLALFGTGQGRRGQTAAGTGTIALAPVGVGAALTPHTAAGVVALAFTGAGAADAPRLPENIPDAEAFVRSRTMEVFVHGLG